LAVAAGIAFAGAFLTRHIGASLLLAAAGLLLFNQRVSLRCRLRDASICCFLAALPAGTLLLRNRFLTGAPTDLTIQWRSWDWEHLKTGAPTLGSWIVPGSDRIELIAGQDLLLVIILLAALVAMVWWRNGAGIDPELRRRPLAFEVGALAYVGFLLIAISVVGAIPLDNRLLAPVFVCALIVASDRIGILQRRAGRSLRQAATAGVVGLAGAYVVAAIAIIAHLHTHGRGYTGDAWRFAELPHAISALEPDVRIFSDVPPAVYFSTGRVACYLPADDRQSPETARWLEEIEHTPVVIVRFGDRRRFPRRQATASPPLETAREGGIWGDLDLQLVVREGGATVHRVAPRNEPTARTH
jgi:hypothetical protein